jgi:hypothetical protein
MSVVSYGHRRKTATVLSGSRRKSWSRCPHRQYVFTVPKILRGAFHQRYRLGELCRIVGRLLSEAYREADLDGQPGFILFVQTFGDLVTFHPHIHALVTDGVFHPNGVFRVLPPIPADLLEQQLRRAVLEMLLADEVIDEDLVAKLLSWQHSGFSVDNQVRIEAGDNDGRQQLARYMIRAPFSPDKTEYKSEQGVIVYRSKPHAMLKRNFQIMPGAKWLEMLLQHVPDRGEHLVRYSGDPSLGPGASLVEGAGLSLLDDQRPGGDGPPEASVSGGLQAAALPGPGRQVL